ncbi:MAG: hypothetical protein LUD48_01030 [Prevotella sp.]|nr:hypothetical protein [Prevotella sp.]
MKKINLLKWGFLCLFCMLTTIGWADTVESVVYTTDFTDWTATTSYKSITNEVVTKQTTTGDDFTFTFNYVGVDPTGTNSKFEDYTGYMVSAKYAEDTSTESMDEYTMIPHAIISALPSVTKIIFTQGATGSTRGVNFYVKGTQEDGTEDTDWVAVYTDGTSSGAHDGEIDNINRTDCQILITDYSSGRNNNFYLLALTIYGNVDSDDITTSATWDWANDQPSGIQLATAYQNNDGYIESTIDGLYLYVDATSGKFNSKDRVTADSPAYDCQMNSGTILHIPVVSENDVVTVVTDDGDWHNFTIGTQTASSTTETYTATSDDATAGYVTLTATGSCYLKSISVTYKEVELDEIGDDFLRPSVSLVSPTQEDLDETPLANETEIKVSVINLPDDGVVYFMLYDSDGNEIDGGQCSEDADGYYTYTWSYYFWDESSASETYTGKIMIYHEDNEAENLIDDAHEIFTTAGLVETTDVTLESVSPEAVTDEDDEEATATIKTSQTEITLTFSAAAKITSASMNLGRGSTEDVEFSNSDNTDTATEWTLTLTSEQMSTALNMGSLSLIVYAEDETGLSIGEYGYISIKYTTVEESEESSGTEYDEIELTYSPDEESEIYGGLVIKATYNYSADDYEGTVYLTPNNGAGIKVTDSNGQEVEDANIDCTTGDSDNECLITIDGLEAGTYNIVIDGQDGEDGEAFYITVGEDWDTTVAVNKATTLTYTITDDLTLALASDDFTGLTPSNLSDCGEISVQTNDCGNLYVTLTITDDQDAENPLTYEMTCDTYDGFYAFEAGDLEDTEDDITMYSGHNYTFTVNAYSSKGDAEAIKTITLYELAGATTENPTTFTMEVVPSSANAEFTSGVEGTLTVNCTDYVTVKATIGETEITATVNGSDVDDNNNSTSWTLTIPAETMTQYAGSSFEITIVATNASEESVTESYTYSVASSTSGEGGEGNNAEVNTTYTYTTTPENNSTISNEDGVSEIVVIYDTELIANWDGDFDYDEFDETSIVVYDDEDNEVTAVKSWGFEEYEEYDEDGVPTVVGYTFTLSDAITTNGTYHFTIPEGAFLLGADQSIVSEEINVTFNIADASGINGITLRATSDDRFYNLNGQRVTSPRNGVFILNGKKVLIK